MKRLPAITTAVLAVVLAVVGCRGKEVEVTPVSAPPALSAQELAAKIAEGLAPLDEFAKATPQRYQVTPEFRDQLMAHLDAAKKEHGNTEEGRKALRLVEADLEEKLRAAKEAQYAALVMLLCDLIEELDPGTSKLARYREWAELERNRPVLVIRGWFQDMESPGQPIYVFLEAYLPATNEVTNVRVREGDEFLGVKLLGIIGKRRGLDLEYLATGERFKVYEPWWPRLKEKQEEMGRKQASAPLQ